MEDHKYISLRDSYVDVEGDAKEVTQFSKDILIGKINIILSTKSLLKTPVKLTKRNFKKVSK